MRNTRRYRKQNLKTRARALRSMCHRLRCLSLPQTISSRQWSPHPTPPPRNCVGADREQEKKKKKSSHKSPRKSTKRGKTTDFKEELRSLDDKLSEHFARLGAMFLATSFAVPVELLQRSDVVVTDRPFIPPVQQTAGVTGQKKATKPVEAASASTFTQPVEVPGILIATQPVEAPGAATEMKPTSQDTTQAADRPEVQVQLARPTPVVDQRYSPQIPLARLLQL